jgi:hypothetical protein
MASRGTLILLALACLSSGAAEVRAQGEPTTRGAGPLLEQLNRETEALYRDVRRGALRVQLPPPRWLDGVAEQESPLDKYKGLDPKVREQLERLAARRAVADGGDPAARAYGDRPLPRAPYASDADGPIRSNGALIVVPPPFLEVRATAPSGGDVPAAPGPEFVPNNIAVVLDAHGHLLVPAYLERVTANERPIRVSGPDGKVLEAVFVGSDFQTNVTVLKLPAPAGEPVRVGAEDRPADGGLVLVVTPLDGSARLGVWTGGGKENGVVFSIDGRCAGVARFGQFLSGRTCRLIAGQIIRHGSVRRATLGVVITELPGDDPFRRKAAGFAQPAMRIDQVIPGSSAERAGVRAGDLLLALAGEPATDIPAVAAAIAARDGPTEIQLFRDGRVVAVTVDLRQK